MSIADHFDHMPEAGFVRSYDSAAARRQFQVSVVLIVLLAAAAMALGMVIRFDDPHATAPAGVPPALMRTVPGAQPQRGATGGQDFARHIVGPTRRG